MRGAPAGPVRACFVRSFCGVVVKEHDLRDHIAMLSQANLFFRLHTALFTPHTSHFALPTPHFVHFTLHVAFFMFYTLHFITTHLISARPSVAVTPFTHNKLLHTANSYTHRKPFTHRSFCTQQAFMHRGLFLHRYRRNCSPKTGPGHQSAKRTILKHV